MLDNLELPTLVKVRCVDVWMSRLNDRSMLYFTILVSISGDNSSQKSNHCY